ncbi:MAG: hypothetical protein QXF56_05620 [Candidatus Micrarchaeia archaeon]
MPFLSSGARLFGARLIYGRSGYVIMAAVEEFSWRNYWKEIAAVALALAYYLDWKFAEDLNYMLRFLMAAVGIWYILKAIEPAREKKPR